MYTHTQNDGQNDQSLNLLQCSLRSPKYGINKGVLSRYEEEICRWPHPSKTSIRRADVACGVAPLRYLLIGSRRLDWWNELSWSRSSEASNIGLGLSLGL